MNIVNKVNRVNSIHFHSLLFISRGERVSAQWQRIFEGYSLYSPYSLPVTRKAKLAPLNITALVSLMLNITALVSLMLNITALVSLMLIFGGLK